MLGKPGEKLDMPTCKGSWLNQYRQLEATPDPPQPIPPQGYTNEEGEKALAPSARATGKLTLQQSTQALPDEIVVQDDCSATNDLSVLTTSISSVHEI